MSLINKNIDQCPCCLSLITGSDHNDNKCCPGNENGKCPIGFWQSPRENFFVGSGFGITFSAIVKNKLLLIHYNTQPSNMIETIIYAGSVSDIRKRIFYNYNKAPCFNFSDFQSAETLFDKINLLLTF